MKHCHSTSKEKLKHGISLTKDVEDLYKENSNSLLKAIEDTRNGNTSLVYG